MLTGSQKKISALLKLSPSSTATQRLAFAVQLQRLLLLDGALASHENISGDASDARHSLVDTVVVNWDEKAKAHKLELRGELVAIRNAARPADEAGLAESDISLNLVAGVGFTQVTTIIANV